MKNFRNKRLSEKYDNFFVIMWNSNWHVFRLMKTKLMEITKTKIRTFLDKENTESSSRLLQSHEILDYACGYYYVLFYIHMQTENTHVRALWECLRNVVTLPAFTSLFSFSCLSQNLWVGVAASSSALSYVYLDSLYLAGKILVPYTQSKKQWWKKKIKNKSLK